MIQPPAEWKRAASILKEEGIKIANVDATVESSLAQKYGVSGYPTIKARDCAPLRLLAPPLTRPQLFRKGKDSEYNGPRQADGIVSYLIDQSAPGAKKLSAPEIEAQLLKLRDEAPEPLVVLFVAKESDFESTGLLGSRTKLASAFATLSETLREQFTFAYTADAAAAAAYGVQPGSVALLHSPLLAGSKLEPAVKPYSGAADAAELEAFVWAASLPLVGELTPRSAPRYAKAGKTLVRVAVPTEWRSDAKGANYFLNRLRKVAAAHPALAFAAVKPEAQLAQLAEFGLEAEAHKFSLTAEAMSAAGGGAKYKGAGAWSPTDPAALVAFAEALAAGSLEAYVKSEPIPEGKANGVTVVVGKTFSDIVLDDSKDVLIEFYAPWCGHCKSLAPKYEELAQKLEAVETLVIAKLDATANDWSQKDVYAVKGFPTIYFKAAGKAPVVYEGEREVAGFITYLSQHATHSFAAPGADKPAKAAKGKKGKKAAAAGHEEL